jgi:AcrR family transcriptional regulator
MTTSRPYHHGNLRQAVLDQAAVMVHDRGASELSLRELAAAIGVTHAAPRRYFAGRQELLDALAVEGFVRLGTRLHEVVEASSDFHEQIRSIARVYLDFATSEANLVELMFAHKHGAGSDAVGQNAEAAFTPILQVFQRSESQNLLRGRKPERVSMVFLAALQGLAGLINCGVIPVGQLEELIDEAVAQFPNEGGAVSTAPR